MRQVSRSTRPLWFILTQLGPLLSRETDMTSGVNIVSALLDNATDNRDRWHREVRGKSNTPDTVEEGM
ncbi:hypothetical protein KIPB_001873 [Kipferlia bialata]|uniref:Uncharacterized protein n=1 Tax=Kipferlia bialata TaxID=797122 RepID=A0A9K3GFH9_9EUKA|nr:hypothetical protein KIPB_000661 [Kipferlia bialata]GIQ80961.1 hypothetical protein KIPB_001847 [Kipferlia bialata]GIQ80973.1 hypothetical protein KIPB_001861 [Kipferlia bialata]GIQ80983.1 hypothetical protein KIPB_001873 [Kipferlia bialata]|eukprot:g661.t1